MDRESNGLTLHECGFIVTCWLTWILGKSCYPSGMVGVMKRFGECLVCGLDRLLHTPCAYHRE